MTPSQGQDLQAGVYQTPLNLLAPINRRWPLCFDLAANASNNVMARLHSRQGLYYGEDDNALVKPWTGPSFEAREFAWCNPPFGDIGTWTAKAQAEAKLGARFVMLLPSATGAAWLVDRVLDLKIVFLVGRPVFEFINAMDHKNPAKRGEPNTDCYGKDLLLVVSDGSRGVEWYDWRKG
jgi:hypothetical protein